MKKKSTGIFLILFLLIGISSGAEAREYLYSHTWTTSPPPKRLSAGTLTTEPILNSRYGQANFFNESTNPSTINQTSRNRYHYQHSEREHQDTLPVGISQGELIPHYTLDPIEIHARRLTPEEKQKYLKLVYNVRKTYPYAVMAKERMESYNAMRDSIGKKKDQRKFLKAEEERIKADFLEDLKGMTKSQGAILIKLLARETDTTAYFLLKDFRGGAKAFAYQTMAVFWGYNLKENYRPDDRDMDIENIVRLIESGKLSTIPPKKTPSLDKGKRKYKDTGKDKRNKQTR